MKIKEVRLSKIKLVEYLGDVEPAWSPGWASQKSTIGGYNFTDQASKIGFQQSFLLKKTQFTDFQYDINLKTVFNDIFFLRNFF